MIQTTIISPGVTLRYVRDTRFKQGCFSFQLVRPMGKEEAAKNALLPAVLLRGTRNCPDLRAVTQRLDELYGAAVSPLVRRVGDYQTTGLYCGFMDDRFALPGDRVLEPMLDFLGELLLKILVNIVPICPVFLQKCLKFRLILNDQIGKPPGGQLRRHGVHRIGRGIHGYLQPCHKLVAPFDSSLYSTAKPEKTQHKNS